MTGESTILLQEAFMTKRKAMSSTATITTNKASNAKPLPEIPPYGEYSIEVENLSFGYSTSNFAGVSKLGDKLILNNLDLKLPTGSRCLLIGANGTF